MAAGPLDRYSANVHDGDYMTALDLIVVKGYSVVTTCGYRHRGCT